ncbi:MAG: hypothetical protein ABH826_04040 [Patescibacteria group bacterium]
MRFKTFTRKLQNGQFSSGYMIFEGNKLEQKETAVYLDGSYETEQEALDAAKKEAEKNI